MQEGLGRGYVGKKATDPVPVDADGGFFGSDNVRQVEAVGLEERLTEKGSWDFEANKFQIVVWGKTSFAELIDVKGELSLNVSVGILGVVNVWAIFFFEFGKLDGDREIDSHAVTDGVADVVGEGADGEGELIGGMRVAEEADDEVSGPDVVSEVGEKRVAEGVVAKVLNGAAAVRVGVSLLELGIGEGGVCLEENGPDGLLPGEVDQLLMGLDGVGYGGR
jgi:hypothetical protein